MHHAKFVQQTLLYTECTIDKAKHCVGIRMPQSGGFLCESGWDALVVMQMKGIFRPTPSPSTIAKAVKSTQLSAPALRFNDKIIEVHIIPFELDERHITRKVDINLSQILLR